MTRAALGSLLVCVVSMALISWAAPASGDSSEAFQASGSMRLSALLLLPGSPTEGEQAHAAAEAVRFAPSAVARRNDSRFKFHGFGRARAREVAVRAFTSAVNEPAGGAPPLPAGERITRFESPTAASVVLADGTHGVIEAAQPIARRQANGGFVPINLSLQASGGSYRPSNPLVNVRIPDELSSGVALSGSGVTLMPEDGSGAALDRASSQNDTSVFFANTQTDADTLAKPTESGVELDTILRSSSAPTTLRYRVNAAAAVELISEPHGAIRVQSADGPIAELAPPAAVDAAGDSVPVTVRVVGRDHLELDVHSAPGKYEYPIFVDPELRTVQDEDLAGRGFPGIMPATNWNYFASQEAHFHAEKFIEETRHEQYWRLRPISQVVGGEYAALEYETKGESRIYEATVGARTIVDAAPERTELLFYTHNQQLTNGLNFGEAPFNNPSAHLCAIPKEVCLSTFGSAGNRVRFVTTATATDAAFTWETELYSAVVSIAQEKAPEGSFNTSALTIASAAGRPNVMYGGEESWLGPVSGAFEVSAADHGLGVSAVTVSGAGLNVHESMRGPGPDEYQCKGVQCAESFSRPFTYVAGMQEGEHPVEFTAEDAAGLVAKTTHTLKVDGVAPYNLAATGLPANGEISAAPHTLTIEATDGTSLAPSSGVREVTVAIDGEHPAAVVGASCQSGQCTASGQWTLHGEALSEGVHRLTINAADNAGNVAKGREIIFNVRHAAPIATGPGLVDPTTGQFSITAQDLSLAGNAGVTRTYQSRNANASAEGPLGPQWTLSLGTGQHLVTLPEGSVALIAADGGRTTFKPKEGGLAGEFESPSGDTTFTLEGKEHEPGKGFTEYVLRNKASGAATTFKQPGEAAPTFANTFGAEASQLHGPTSDAIDPSGNVWVTDSLNHRILKYTGSGTLVAAYGGYGSGAGQMIAPWGVAVDPRNGNVFVTDQGNNRVDEFSGSGSFIRAFGWGVATGASEAQVCTSSCKAGLAGNGTGQFYVNAGLDVDQSGNVWVADYGNNRIQEFNESGQFVRMFGSVGEGTQEFRGPLDVAVTGGNVYITDLLNQRIQVFSTSGAPVRRFGKEGPGEVQFKNPYGIAADPKTGNLYVADSGNGRIEEVTTTGAYVTSIGAPGTEAGQLSSPTGVAAGGGTTIFAVDNGTNRVEEWAADFWLPTTDEGPLETEHLSSETTTYSYETVLVEGRAITRPTKVLEPPPAGVSCAPKLERGCRALTFKYAEATAATGENETEWGDIKGQLARVYSDTWDPSKGAMAETEVARYVYDAKRRLRAEWDPRVSEATDCGGSCGALKKVYGYDSEGHVTVLTPPGQAAWTLTYGTIAGDLNAGRVVKANRATTTAWDGHGPNVEEAPKLSGTPALGVTLGVTKGKWAHSPLSYGYQWENCTTEGTGCAPIAGATNPNYTITESDVGRRLVALVTATNTGGSATAASAASATAQITAVTEYNLPEAISPTKVAAGPDGNLWLLDVPLTGTQKIVKVSPTGSVGGEYSLPTGSSPSCIVVGPDGKLWFTNRGTNKIGKITTSGTINEYALPSGSSPECITSGPDGNLWFTDHGTNKIGKITTAGTILSEYALPAGSGPNGITPGPDGQIWFTNGTTSKIGKITTSGVRTEYGLPEGASPGQITAGPSQTLWFARGSGIEKSTTSGAVTSVIGQNPNGRIIGIALGPDNNVWFTSSFHVISTTYSLGRVTPSGTVTEYALGTEPHLTGITAGPEEDMWFTESGHKLGKATTRGQSGINGELRGPEPGWTLEYGLPVSGTGAPYALGAAENEAWAQNKDDPVEGMAVFPADEPQGWPASSFKRATIHYLDARGREVNLAQPGGGIATTEFNETNNQVRTLSADNRAAALKEGARSAEVAEQLDTKRAYSASGAELLEVIGPEHKVKLPSGSEAQARRQVKYSYDQGAPGGAVYGLVTKETDAALVGGKAEDVRTTLTSYSGQEGLGWKLRKATSTTADPSGVALVRRTLYDPTTGSIVEARKPGADTEAVYPPAFASSFGSLGSGNGQFKEPCGVAIDSAGNLWVVDAENGRIQKLSSAGAFLAAYGSKGSGNLQFQRPFGIAINPSTGNVYVGDYGNNRVEELSSAGSYVTSFGTTGSGALLEPMGVTIDASGNVWVADRGHNRVVEFSAEGTYIRAVGTAGSGNGQLSAPIGLAISEGSLFVVDSGNSRVEQFSLTGEYLGQFGSTGTGTGQLEEPFGLGVNSSTGNLYVADLGNQRVDEFSPAGRYLTQWETWGPSHQLSRPIGLAVGTAGKLVVTDVSAGKLSTWTPPEAGAAHLHFSSSIGSTGSGNGQFSTPIDVAFDGEGNIWASDLGNNRIEKFSSKGSWIASYGALGSGNEQFNAPGGIDVNQGASDVYIADTNNARIIERSTSGTFIRKFGTEGAGKLTRPGSLKIDTAGNVWVPDMSANKIFEFSSTGTFIAAYGKEGSGAGEVAFKKPIALAIVGENVYVADSANHRVLEMTNKGAFVREFAKEGSGSGELYDPEGIAADGAGNLYVADEVAGHVEEFSSSGAYMATFSSKGSGEGQLKGPVGDAIDAAGNLFVVDSELNRIEKWSAINPAVGYAKTIYYTAGANSEYPSCGGHPEWITLKCQTQPAAQPNTPGLPNLPVTRFTYNLWDEVETTTETIGSATRTRTQTYDRAGRTATVEQTATTAAALPKVTFEYSKTIGAVEKQSTTAAGQTKTITSLENSLGKLERYTDADGNTSKYTYDIDERVEEMSDGKGFQIYVHDPTSGNLTSLFDSAAGTFAATYTAGGALLTQTYPDGLKATYSLNSLAEQTGVEYLKTNNCSQNCTWLTDAVARDIHGDVLSQSSTLATENYTVDSIGRLTQAQETPAGKGCVVRLYGYDEESNRTTMTTRPPGAEGHCATEGGTTEAHLYDAANRLIDTGTTYDELGDTTHLPAADAGGNGLTSSFYVDGQIATQTQNGQALSYTYDPAGRVRETVGSGKSNFTAIAHYAAPGEAPVWTSEGGEAWTRNIPGIDGTLCATQSNGGTPVLQLNDLEGNVIATAALSPTETKLLSTYNSTEFGVPQASGAPPRYAWLGAGGRATEPAMGSGVMTSGGGSYVPSLGRELQTFAVVPPGAVDPYAEYGVEYTSTVSAESRESAQAQSEKVFEEAEAARQKAAEEEAARAQQQCEEEGGCGAVGPEGADPTISISLTPGMTKVLLYALQTGHGLTSLITKWLKLKGLEADALAEVVQWFSGGVIAGLNLCLESWRDIGSPSGKEFRCRATFTWDQIGSIPWPEELSIETCFYDAGKKSHYDCGEVYGIKNPLS